MSVNIVALIPYKGINEESKKLIETLETDLPEFQKYFKALQQQEFSVHDRETYWYDEKLYKRQEKPDEILPMRDSLIHKYYMYFFFGKNTIYMSNPWRFVSMVIYENIQKTFMECVNKVGSLTNAKECYIIGDNHPLHFICFESKGKFRNITRWANQNKEQAKDGISGKNGMYIKIEEGLYDVKGYYKHPF